MLSNANEILEKLVYVQHKIMKFHWNLFNKTFKSLPMVKEKKITG